VTHNLNSIITKIQIKNKHNNKTFNFNSIQLVHYIQTKERKQNGSKRLLALGGLPLSSDSLWSWSQAPRSVSSCVGVSKELLVEELVQPVEELVQPVEELVQPVVKLMQELLVVLAVLGSAPASAPRAPP
jgi:hypothetical protein